MTYIIYGVGAIGGTLAGRLAEAGKPVAGIARGKQLDALRTNGLLLKTPEGDVRTRFPVAEDPSDLKIAEDDVIFLAMKGQDTAEALLSLRDAGVTSQPVVCAQNGVANERAALRFFPNVYAMTVIVPSTFVEPGEVAAFGTPISGILDIGRYPDGIDEATEAMVEALKTAKFAAFAQPHAMRSKYGKLLSNLGNVFDAAAGDGAQQSPLLDEARAEAEAVYRAAGVVLDDKGTPDDQRSDRLMDMGTIAGRERVGSSSSQSLVRGTGSIETDYLNGEIVLLARIHGVPAPINGRLQALGHRLIAEKLKPGDLSLAEVEAFVRGR